MQSLKLQSLAWRSRPSLRFLPHHRRLSASVAAATAIQDDNLQNQVLVEGKASARAAILNRPNSLNALTSNMGIRLKKLYESWEDNADIGFVMMKVAVLDGITMGGGGGISVPGTFRIATDKTVFSTPEIHIGFHPDAAASFYLSHLTGYVGEYLALTGEKINGVDMLALGLATHYSMSARLSWIDERLAKLVTDDPSVLDSSLAQYGDVVYPDKQSIVHRLEAIDRCFSRETVEEIIDALEEEAARSNQDWCHRALKKLKEASPLSLKVSLRSIREGRYQTLDECLIREYRMSLHVISKEVSPDFCEGIRARLVEKDIEPKWDPPTLKHVSDDMVDHYFSPLGEFEPELKLPTHLREAFI
ncbi:uncharacterized protein A4U43_C04F35560 [Asparagus officinalis]|uniref:3-hydroxyisobutyryl-CoA hydrolase n=1 Tax=Asparagus officinalis TaxID=4686 RepID=A0A5P1F6R7_ASPOF|nr:uncharacterized protein A4U43_C04F35560 [Asparagus officinalis]